MKKILFISLFLILPQTLVGQSQRELPNEFFMKCEIQILNYGKSWLFKVDRKNKTSEVKTPMVNNDFKICKEDEDQIIIKRNCSEVLNEFKFNKWNGSLLFDGPFGNSMSKKPCDILSIKQKPLYK